jgi:predicted PurR-regulated permease PerM
VGVAAVAILWLIMASAVSVLVLIAVAILVAVALEPVVTWLRSKTGLARGATVLIVYAAFLAIFVTLLVLVVPAAIGQIGRLSAEVPTLIANLQAWVANVQPEALRQGLTDIIDSFAREATETPSNPDVQDLIAAGLSLAEAVFAIITLLTLVFFWLTGHQRIERFTLALIPLERRPGVHEAWSDVEERLGLWVRGQAILMFSIFAMTTVAYFLLGLPNALLLGIVAGIAELVPILGPALGAIPALLAATLMPDPFLAVILVGAVYVAIQVIEGNVLVPIVMRRTIGVPPFLVVISLLIGAAAGGLAGALLAVPLTAAVVVILERMQARETSVPLESTTTGDSEKETDEPPGDEAAGERSPAARSAMGSPAKVEP